MYGVGIVFKNGEKMFFGAQEFDVDLSHSQFNPPNTYKLLHRFEYKDREGNQAPLYLVPAEVAGIVVSSVDSGGFSVNFP